MLTSTVEVLECREHERYAVVNVWGLLLNSLATYAKSHTHKFIVAVAHCDAESIGASPVIMACKTAKLFKFLQVPTECERTIG